MTDINYLITHVTENKHRSAEYFSSARDNAISRDFLIFHAKIITGVFSK